MSKDKNGPVVAKRAVASVAKTGRGGRFSAPRKAQAVLRLLRGEDLELLSRELGVIASTLSLWREEFLAAGQAVLKGKSGKADVRDEQISRLKNRASPNRPISPPSPPNPMLQLLPTCPQVICYSGESCSTS